MSSHATLHSIAGLAPFEYHPRTRLMFGEGWVEKAGELAGGLGGHKVLLVTDPGLVKAGHARRVRQILERSGLETALFDQVHENPTTRDVEACASFARQAQVDLLVGLGGGSAMDTAKGCNFILTNGGQMQDYWGVGKAAKPMLPLLAIPTTAGTGSECQSAALIADERTHEKMACLDPKAAPRIALLDPVLTVSQPPAVTAHAGIDAVAHALETAVTTRRNPLSALFAVEAFKLTFPSLAQVLAAPADVKARGRMLLGAAYAGIAIENSMLGAAHAAANPLTAHFGIVHGAAVGIMLPAVVRYNAQEPGALRAYAQLAAACGLASGTTGEASALEALLKHLASLLNTAGLARSLAPLNVPESDLPRLAREAAGQWTARFNPRPLTDADFLSLYQFAFQPRGD